MSFVNRKAIDVITSVAIIVMYFMLYDHYWYLALAGWQNKKLLHILSFACLSYIFIIVIRRKEDMVERDGKFTKRLFLLLLVYFLLSLITVIYNEKGFDNTKRYLFNLLSPVILLVIVMYIYNSNDKIQAILRILIIAGVVISIYAVYTMVMLHHGAISGYYTDDKSPYKQRVGSLDYDYLERFSVPGLGPNLFPSMLVPLVLSCFYFSRNSSGILSGIYLVAMFFLYCSMIMTSSRGAFISLLAGLTYLSWKRWFTFDRKSLLVFICLAAITIFQGALISRMYEVKKEVTNIVEITLRKTEKLEHDRARYSTIIDSIERFLDSPMIGYGFTKFSNAQRHALQTIEHNFYLRMLSSGGVFLLISLVSILGLLYVTAAKTVGNANIDSETMELGVLLNAVLLAWIVDLNFSPGFLQYYWIWFGFVAAWIRNSSVYLKTV